MMIPFVIENSGRGERAYDIFSKLMEDRIIFIGHPIDEMIASIVIAQLLVLASDNAENDIKLYINSPGGSITDGLAILDTMNLVEPDIQTFCVGEAASMAAVLLAAGTKGKRYALPNSRVLIHQPSVQGLHGQTTDIEIYAKELTDMKAQLNEILAEATGQPLERIAKDVERDYIMRPQQALEYGVIDKIVKKRK